MEIGLIFSGKDPQQAEARDFLRKYVRERGMLAKIVELDKPVKSPTVVINGHALTDLRRKPRKNQSRMYPAIADIARALEKHLWMV